MKQKPSSSNVPSVITLGENTDKRKYR